MAWGFTQQSKEKSITVGVPHRGSFSARWVAGISAVSWPESPYYFYQHGQTIDTARNIIAAKCMQLGSGHLFFLDDDIILRTDTVTKLMQNNLPVVSGAYRSRAHPYELVANINDKPIPLENLGKEAVMEAETVGAGCLLIESRVLHRLGRKMNDFFCMLNHAHDSGQEVLSYTYKEAVENNYKCKKCGGLCICKFFDYRLGKFKNNAYSEDYVFCNSVRGLGIPVFVSMKAIVDHEIGDNMVVNESGVVNRTVGASEVR